jgi:1-phosphatidylinositol phosphodiesterase
MTSSNTVNIKSKSSNLTITKITYVSDTLNAPSGTDAPAIQKNSDTSWSITLKCDRDGSSAYADSFNDVSGGAYHEYAPDDGGAGKQPDKLNFYFGVSITFAFKDGSNTIPAVAPVVYLGQGHYSTTNNWWIGGREAITNVDNKTPMLLAEGGIDEIVLGISGDTSEFDFTWKSKSANFALGDWMANIPDSTSLFSMTIPGTHDTCSLYGGDAVETQTRKLEDQLVSGIRFIDIRCRHIDDVFTIHHGLVYQKINFGNGVLKVCLDFLKEHPKETIVMSVKPEYDPSNNTRTFEQTFLWYLKQYECGDKWWLEGTMPTLGQVRGKIVLFRRFPTDHKDGEEEKVLGLKALPFEDDKTFSIDDTVDMMIQDQWKVPTLFARSDKWSAINALLQDAKNGSDDVLYVNFCSGTSSGCYPYSCANYVNPQLVQYFTSNTSGRFGCVLMDFEYSDLTRLIAETNI